MRTWLLSSTLEICITSGRGYQNIAEFFSYLEIDANCRLELKTNNLLKGSLKKTIKEKI